MIDDILMSYKVTKHSNHPKTYSEKSNIHSTPFQTLVAIPRGTYDDQFMKIFL